MSASTLENPQPGYNVDERAPHTLHESTTAAEFERGFMQATGAAVQLLTEGVIAPEAARAMFLVGSLPLGMATSGSDIDIVVLVDDRSTLLDQATAIVNSDQQLVFANDRDPLLAGMFLLLKSGILIDLQVAITPEIHRIQQRLRRRGPELSETEIRTLGRLGGGWLLAQSDGYLERNRVVLDDPALNIYCCTRNLVSAQLHRRKALKAVEQSDWTLALHLGRSSVEWACLAYFASEAMPYLGAKWPAQIGHARGAAERLRRHPLLTAARPLLFPGYESAPEPIFRYLEDVGRFLVDMQTLMEEKVLFKIAFEACPQIHAP